MRTIILVAKNELITKLTQRSFWLLTIGMPLFFLVFSFGIQFFSAGMMVKTIREDATFEYDPQQAELGGSSQSIGFVDHAGILLTLPSTVEEGQLQAFPDEASAQNALALQAIVYYYIIPEDFMETGKLTVIENEFRPFRYLSSNNPFYYTLNYNLTGDALTTTLIQDPIRQTEQLSLSPNTTAPGANNPLAFFVPFITMFIFFYILTTTSGLMLESVTKEKATHLLEILLLSTSPKELITGKILGLSLIALIQMAFWSLIRDVSTGGNLLTFIRKMVNSGMEIETQLDVVNTSPALTLPTGFFLWGILYLLLGYFFYATAMGAAGALMPHSGESSTITMIAYIPLFLGMILSFDIIRSPHGKLALFLSFFPLTSPISMMTRLSASHVPLTQILLSLGVLALTTYGMLAVAAHVLRPEAMLSEAPWAFLTRKRPHEQ